MPTKFSSSSSYRPKMLLLVFELVAPNKASLISTNDVDRIHEIVREVTGLDEGSYFLKSNGYVVVKSLDIGNIVEVIPRLRGGKGGFGSMLRAIGAQIEKTTNREACRDLSGRRLRDINEEQRLKKWISQQSDREKELEEKKKKKLEKLAQEPKHEFKDEAYDTERSDLTEKLADSVEQGFKATVDSAVKRKSGEAVPVLKKKKKTILDDDFSSSDDEESGETLQQPSNSTAVSARQD